MELKSTEFPKPKFSDRLTNNDILFGDPVSPIDRLKIVSPEVFEEIIAEWGNGFLIQTGKYTACKKCSGAGDMGRDVISIINESLGTWDNYQCKHYDHPLMPSDIWIEIGKLVYYTFMKEYTLPEAYYFVAPQGIGPALNNFFENPAKLKNEFLNQWDAKCKNEITTTKSITLDDKLKRYINRIDFKIFKGYDPNKLIEEHKKTSYYAARFGGGLIKKRQDPQPPPKKIGKDEMVYTRQLFEAYSDHKKKEIKNAKELQKHRDLEDHFIRQRESFYTADALRQFSRDNLPEEIDYFEELKGEVHTGVIDVHNGAYGDGYRRLLATVIQAKNIQITASPLENYIQQKDREGICHHLANDNKLIWVRK